MAKIVTYFQIICTNLVENRFQQNFIIFLEKCQQIFKEIFTEICRGRVTANLAHFWSRDFGTELCAK